MADKKELREWRKEFPILENSTYLVSHSMGAMPRRAYDRLKEYGDDWARDGIDAYAQWLPRLREISDLAGSIVNAPSGSTVFHQNVSTLTSIVISAIHKPGGRKKVILTDLNFPSLYYAWKRHEEVGLEIQVIKSPDGIVIPTEEIIDAIDEETLCVALDHGIFRSGYLIDIDPIAKAAREKGAFTFIDAYQTIGCVPIDVQAWGIDFLVAGSHKWLCGGPGAAFLHVRPDLIPKLEPRIAGWFSHQRPFDFDLDLEYADNAMRFSTGTPNIAAVQAARTGYEIISEVGVDRIREKSVRLTSKLIELAREEGLRINSPTEAARRTGVVCIDFEGAERAEVDFIQRRIQVDYRPRCGLRVSAHFYTTEEEFLSIIPEIQNFRKKS